MSSPSTKSRDRRQRLLNPLFFVALSFPVLLFVHELARVAGTALGGAHALMSSFDLALPAALAFLVLFTARLLLLFVVPGLLLGGLSVRLIRVLRARTQSR